MAKTSFPSGADVQALLTRAGFTAGATEAGYAADAAADEFERRTGRKVLAPAGDITHLYDPPVSGLLDLGRDLAQLGTVSYAPQGGSSETLTAYTDYFPLRYSDQQDPEPLTGPYWAIEFVTRRWTFPLASANRRSIVIVGKWGLVVAATGMPEDLWQAVLHRAGARLLPELGSAAAVARTQRTEAGVQTSWGGDPNGGVTDRWDAEFEAAVRRYRRLGL